MTIVYNPFTDNLDYKGSSGGGGGVTTITGDTGSITGSSVTIFADQANNNSGASVAFKNATDTSTFNLTDIDTQNTFLGWSAGNPAAIAAQTCTANTGVGVGALNLVTSSSFNVAVGVSALGSLQGTVGVGTNIAIGWTAGNMLVDGVDNIFIGFGAGTGYTGSETGNITIGAVAGSAGEDYILRIGPTTGGAAIQQAYIGGITGITAGASSPVLVNGVGQLSDAGFGTAGQVFTSNGAGNSPTWQAAGGGGGITEYFNSYLGSPTVNITGDGTIVPLVCDVIITNTSSSYNPATGVYTAPSGGQYMFFHTVCFAGADATNDGFLTLWNGSTYSTRAYQTGQYNPASGTIIFSAALGPIPLAGGDTMAVSCLANGSASKNVLLYGAAPSGFATISTFTGFKMA